MVLNLVFGADLISSGIFLVDANPIRLQRRDDKDQPWHRLP
jgi:hypothetical protein